MKFTLILATINTDINKIERFLGSLNNQTYRNFELIIVDQNDDERLKEIVEKFSRVFPIIYLRSAQGLSRSRNVGLRHARGEIISFPDDDCWYPVNLLEQVAQFLQANSDIDGLTGRVIDENENPSAGRFDTTSGFINRFNVWRRGWPISMFLRSNVIKVVGDFDETLGAGAGTPWGSGEETDYLLRALNHGFRLYYNPNISVYHPHPVEKCHNAKALLKRAIAYSCGMGYVLRKHQYPVRFIAYWELRSLVGILIGLIQMDKVKVLTHCGNVIGRLRGWRGGSVCKEKHVFRA
jgi:glycosyltransferase involved in cell wall biosynthesis